MAPTTATDPISAAIQAALTTGLKLNISGTLPGEALLTAMFQYFGEVRKTTDSELQKKADAIAIQMLIDVYGVWRGIWVALGVVK